MQRGRKLAFTMHEIALDLLILLGGVWLVAVTLRPLVKARALVANGDDEYNATLAWSARELGFDGPIVALIDNPNRRAPLQLAGHHPYESSIDESRQCRIVAVERNAEIIMDIPSSFTLDTDDDIYVCGTVEALNRFYGSFQQGEDSLKPVTK